MRTLYVRESTACNVLSLHVYFDYQIVGLFLARSVEEVKGSCSSCALVGRIVLIIK